MLTRFALSDFPSECLSFRATNSMKQSIFDIALPRMPDNAAFSKITYRTNIQRLLRNQLREQKTRLVTLDGYYDYSDESTVYVVFAARHLGGGYKGYGWVQEEIICVEFPQMALGIHILESLRQNELRANQGVLWLGLTQTARHNPVLYGGNNIRKESPSTFDARRYVAPLATPSGKKINFLSMNCINRSTSEGAPYSAEELNFLFVKCMSCFVGASASGFNSISTGLWGCGAFKNNPGIILAVQLTCALATGITTLNFYGCGSLKSADAALFYTIVRLFNSDIHHSTPADFWNATVTLTSALPFDAIMS